MALLLAITSQMTHVQFKCDAEGWLLSNRLYSLSRRRKSRKSTKQQKSNNSQKYRRVLNHNGGWGWGWTEAIHHDECTVTGLLHGALSHESKLE